MSSKNNDLKNQIKKPRKSPANHFFNNYDSNEENIDVNVNNNVNDKEEKQKSNTNDTIDSIIKGNNKKSVKTLEGVYLDPDVKKVLKTLAKKGGKGAKSQIVNEALKALFQGKNLL